MPAVPNPDLRTWPLLAARWQSTHTYTPHKRAQKKGDVSLTLSKMGRQMPSRPLVELVPSLEIWLVKTPKSRISLQPAFAAPTRVCCDRNFTQQRRGSS